MQLDICFLGKIFPKQIEAQIKSKMKTGMQDAGNALQWNIIDGLDENECGAISILDQLPINSYPNGYVDRYIEEYIFQHTDRYLSDDKVVGCTNLSIVKQFSNLYPFKREVKKWAKKDSQKKKVLMMYTASRMFLQLAKYVKSMNPEIETCCVIADLPEFISARKITGLLKYFNKYETYVTNNLYRYVDKFVLLTDQMAGKLNIKVPYIVMEGIAPNIDVDTDPSIADEYKGQDYVLYSGTLNYEFGIGTLLEAFSLIENKNLKLLICGFGEAEAAIRESEDERVVFLGKIERNQVLALQRNAAILVNPRQNTEEFTKYSFPSKTMEYLAAGVPVIAYKLDGIPEEYNNYINYVSDNSPESLAKEIERIYNLPLSDRLEIGEKGKHYVIDKKNRIAQTKRIVEFLSADRS